MTLAGSNRVLLCQTRGAGLLGIEGARLGMARQKVNYHLRALEANELVR